MGQSRTLPSITASKKKVLRSIKGDSSSTTGSIDIAVAEDQIMNRRDRTIALLQRFRE